MCIRDRFDSVSALSSDDTELEATWKSEHSLEAFTAADQFKSYEDLEKRLNLVLGTAKRVSQAIDESLEDESEGRGPAPSSFRQQMSAPVKKEAVVEDDDALSYFASLASDD